MNYMVTSQRQPLASEASYAPPPRVHHLRINFTGSGSEYFRIWIVNLLLTLVTLGLYYPWAKVRRLRYFYSNTVVGGEAMEFHADPKKVFKGYLLAAVLFGLYSQAGKFSATAGFVAFLIIAALWPALFRSSLRFRMTNTSWRGLRFHFKGSTGGAYHALLPLFVPSAIILGAVAMLENPEKPPMWYLQTVGIVSLGMFVLAPWLLWNLKRYQHNHYALSTLQTTFKAGLGAFYKLHLKAYGVALLTIALTAGLVAGVFFLMPSVLSLGLRKGGATGAAIFGAVIGVFVGMAVMFAFIKPYFTTRLQNLVWTQTGNSSMRFLSTLSVKSVLWLTVKNWVVILVTLGLYWPFAAVAMARLRLEAVSVRTRLDPEKLIGLLQAQNEAAAGDAVDDFLGIDIGF